MRDSRIFVAILLVAGGLLLAASRGPYALWDGRFPLTVHLLSSSGCVQSVVCEPALNLRYAEDCLEELSTPESRSPSATLTPYDGKPLEVWVPVSGKTSWTGRELERTLFRYLAVIVVLKNGERLGKVVEIPDGRRSRQINVAIP